MELQQNILTIFFYLTFLLHLDWIIFFSSSPKIILMPPKYEIFFFYSNSGFQWQFITFIDINKIFITNLSLFNIAIISCHQVETNTFIFAMKKIKNFSRQIKVVNSYLAYNRNIFTNFWPWKKLTIFLVKSKLSQHNSAKLLRFHVFSPQFFWSKSLSHSCLMRLLSNFYTLWVVKRKSVERRSKSE